MKIKVISDGRRFTIPLPNGIVINGFTAKIASHFINKHTEFDISKEQLDILCCKLKEAKKVLDKRPLLYVNSKDGEMVEITL